MAAARWRGTDEGGALCELDCLADHFLDGSEGLGSGEAGAASETDGAVRTIGERNENDAAGLERVRGEGWDESRSVPGSDKVNEGLEGCRLHGALEASADVRMAVFGSAGGESVVGEAVSVGEDEEFVFEG